MPKTSKTSNLDLESLQKGVQADPKSSGWNNAASRSNLKQYQPKVIPEIIDGEVDDDEADVSAIVVGRKLSPELVRKLMPQRGVLTAAEKKRYVGIVQQFLADFKNEEPTAADVDDIFEIAEADIMKTRLLHAAKDSPDTLIHITQSIERIHKRKQTAKENLSARRSDRKDVRSSQDLNIVDLVVRFDLEQKRKDEERVASLLEEEEDADKLLTKVLEEDGY
jgi:hypothetical protein